MQEEILKALVELAQNQNVMLKSLSKLVDDMEEVKSGILFLTGKSNEN